MTLVRYLSPGAYPGPRGTPLAIRWLAEAWIERGGRAEIWTGDARRRTPAPVPGRPLVRVRRFGATELSESSGPSVQRLRALQALAKGLLGAEAAVIHAHGPDAAWLCRLLRSKAWVAHRHTDMVREMEHYWPSLRGVARVVGHVLDVGLTSSRYQLSFHAADSIEPLGPVVPDYEIAHVARYRQPPAREPTVVYLGNADSYQELNRVFAAPWPAFVRRLWIVNHAPPRAVQARARDAGFAVHHASTAAEALELASGAWWGVCPRTLAAGYPYKLLSYGMLGLPVLSSRDWPGPVELHRVPSWPELRLEWREPPARTTSRAIRESSKRTLIRLEALYGALSSLLLRPG